MDKVKLRIMGLMIVLTVFALYGCGGSGSDGIVGSVGTETAGLQHLVFLRGTSDQSSAALSGKTGRNLRFWMRPRGRNTTKARPREESCIVFLPPPVNMTSTV
jgi:hypothetical protein